MGRIELNPNPTPEIMTTYLETYRGYELHSARELVRFACCPNRSIRVLWTDPKTCLKMKTYGMKYWQNGRPDLGRALTKTKRSLDRLIDRGKLPDLMQLTIPGLNQHTKEPSNATLPHCTP